MENEPNPEMANQSSELADLLRHFGDEFGFDGETCEEVAAMDFPDAFEATYGYLTQAGLDPDEVLAPFMEQPQE